MIDGLFKVQIYKKKQKAIPFEDGFYVFYKR